MTGLPDQQHVFYRGTDQHIHHIFWDAVSAKLDADDWTLRARAPLAAGDPATLATPGQQHVFYRGVDGRIHHLLWVWDKRRLYRNVWSAESGAPTAAGDPVTLETPGQQHVFYLGIAGNVCHIFWDASAGRVFFDDWTVKSGGAPAAAESSRLAALATNSQQHVFYRDARGSIQHILWDGSSNTFGHDDWTRRAGAPPAAGDPAAMATLGQQHVFYRGEDRAIHHILWASLSGAWHHDDWTTLAHARPAEGDPATLVTDEGQQHVFYLGAGGAIHHIFWDPSAPPGQLGFDDWSSRSIPHADAAASGALPATLLFAGQQHVFYRGSRGAVDHILWDPSSNKVASDDWTSRTLSPIAAGNPATLLTADSPGDHTWKVLPLGDSLTEGFGYPGGYRIRLFEAATHWGKRIDFVGNEHNGPSDVGGVPFPDSHEGHSGKDIGFIAGIVTHALKPAPDIVLLMIGTNDVLQATDLANAPRRLAGLLDQILAADVGALLVVAQIPPIPEHLGEVIAYNQGVAAEVRKRADAGERIVLADMHTGFPLWLLQTNNPHPNRQGYEHIAAVWYAAIEGFLS